MMERSIDFYTQKLGFEVYFRYEDFYAGIRRDGHSIHLKLGKPTQEERMSRRNNEHLDITFSVEGVDALPEDFKMQSVEVTQPPRDMPYGREFYISDPDGYISLHSSNNAVERHVTHRVSDRAYDFHVIDAEWIDR